MTIPSLLLAALAAVAVTACRTEAPEAARTDHATQSSPAAEVRMDANEAEASLAILATLRTGNEPKDESWKLLFDSEGYRRLKRREESMQRSFEDAAFAAFLRSGQTQAAGPTLRSTLDDWLKADTDAAARRAQAYLPAGTRIRATLYPVIKPQTNSFVFETGTDSPAIFMYLDPNVTHAKLENTLAHELHHIGYATACAGKSPETLPERVGTAMTWAGAFGEGLAMLAAAGGPRVHPHEVSETAERARWDKDVANVPEDLERVETFFMDVIEGRLTGDDAVRDAGMSFFGVQGPWYTVGWSMAVTIEEIHGKERLIEVMCDPRLLLATYNAAAMESTSNGAPKPLWSEKLMERLGP